MSTNLDLFCMQAVQRNGKMTNLHLPFCEQQVIIFFVLKQTIFCMQRCFRSLDSFPKHGYGSERQRTRKSRQKRQGIISIQIPCRSKVVATSCEILLVPDAFIPSLSLPDISKKRNQTFVPFFSNAEKVNNPRKNIIRRKIICCYIKNLENLYLVKKQEHFSTATDQKSIVFYLKFLLRSLKKSFSMILKLENILLVASYERKNIIISKKICFARKFERVWGARFNRCASRSVLSEPRASRSVLYSSHTFKFISYNLILKLRPIL